MEPTDFPSLKPSCIVDIVTSHTSVAITCTSHFPPPAPPLTTTGPSG